MTDNNHPITPSEDLIQQLREDCPYHVSAEIAKWLAIKAARWGADQEMEACLEEIRDGAGRLYVDDYKLRVCLADDIWTARRSKPKGLAEQKQAIHDEIHQLLAQISANNAGALAVAEPIRHALKRLQWLEEGDE